jgi:hypothetical protein
MGYDEIIRKIGLRLLWLNANARHAIELKETFTFPAYDPELRKIINGNPVRCYKICLDAIYFEFIMTLMRMYDTYRSDDTVCFAKLFSYLSADLSREIESRTQRSVENDIYSAQKEYTKLKDSHLIARLQTVRNKMFAHTSVHFDKRQVANYGYAEQLLKKTLPMLNNLNSAIFGNDEPFDNISKYWKGYAKEFWQSLVKKMDNGQQAAPFERE